MLKSKLLKIITLLFSRSQFIWGIILAFSRKRNICANVQYLRLGVSLTQIMSRNKCDLITDQIDMIN